LIRHYGFDEWAIITVNTEIYIHEVVMNWLVNSPFSEGRDVWKIVKQMAVEDEFYYTFTLEQFEQSVQQTSWARVAKWAKAKSR
jgi:hypothetical protein